ncbi:expressed unknown protein [Seminavis robusta]|uniref:Uncharacterized protein n=1 Tax=Seminavis robusta TaxID=568900 RepID=A0A9N8DVB7_9STRA|nr:expressed unknown protein [Seminavis robusta]|eukprot:Sro398_g134720.1 n/a (165) ;mRNA; r:49516-50010
MSLVVESQSKQHKPSRDGYQKEARWNDEDALSSLQREETFRGGCKRDLLRRQKSSSSSIRGGFQSSSSSTRSLHAEESNQAFLTAATSPRRRCLGQKLSKETMGDGIFLCCRGKDNDDLLKGGHHDHKKKKKSKPRSLSPKKRGVSPSRANRHSKSRPAEDLLY